MRFKHPSECKGQESTDQSISLQSSKGRYVFSWGGRAGASEGRVISESEH